LVDNPKQKPRRGGASTNFAGSESGQIQRVKNLQNMVFNSTGLNIPPPLPATHCLNILYLHTGKGGRRVEKERW
jgi:hypothetical protein